jgi:predicted RNA binding protein YcfA (HicA-like mRNA interferase family)
VATDSTGIIRKIKKDGWFEVAQRGSHVQFKHATKPGRPQHREAIGHKG